MKLHHDKFHDILKSNEVFYVNVLWTSRPTQSKNSREDMHCDIVINPNNMLKYWSYKCKKFVCDNELKAYGFQE